jgi:phage-related tail fiber protein
MSLTQINGGTQVQDATLTPAKVTSGVIIAAGTNPFTGDQSLGGFKITSLGTPTSSTDAATKAYVDAAVNGLDWKASVRAATTANGALATAYENGDVIDGVTLATGDRILIKNQTTGSENGIYTVNASGAPTRATDADASAEVTAGLAVFVSEGTVNADTQWGLTTNDPITLGTTALTFAQIGAGTTYTGSNGISVAGTVISPTYGTTANTICQGNDSRLSDARTPVGTSLSSANIWVGNGSNLAAAVALSGDVTITNAGVATVANQVKLAKVITRETPAGTINGSNAVFTTANGVVAGTESVYLNGILQDAGAGNDYVFSSTNTITFNAAPVSGDKIRVSYISTYQGALAWGRHRYVLAKSSTAR